MPTARLWSRRGQRINNEAAWRESSRSLQRFGSKSSVTFFFLNAISNTKKCHSLLSEKKPGLPFSAMRLQTASETWEVPTRRPQSCRLTTPGSRPLTHPHEDLEPPRGVRCSSCTSCARKLRAPKRPPATTMIPRGPPDHRGSEDPWGLLSVLLVTTKGSSQILKPLEE